MIYSILKMIIMSIYDLFKYFLFGEYNKDRTKSYGHPDFDSIRLVKNIALVVMALTIIVLYKIDIELLRASKVINVNKECLNRETLLTEDSNNTDPIGSN